MTRFLSLYAQQYLNLGSTWIQALDNVISKTCHTGIGNPKTMAHYQFRYI